MKNIEMFDVISRLIDLIRADVKDGLDELPSPSTRVETLERFFNEKMVLFQEILAMP
ncbi:MAG TPA: hypothetical protein VKK79_15590 [Candidatus Lokiarchaeia archaeon]|nr:hypothetical protein [Candidatus Lokiarchaeia archaeon]